MTNSDSSSLLSNASKFLTRTTVLKAKIYSECLKLFIKDAWPVIEPATDYVHGWHIDAISEHLEAVTRLQIQNLIINIPPRHMKSRQVAVFWMPWVWTFWPESKWLFASYAEGLAMRDSVACRDLIRSPWYQALYGEVFRLSEDQNQKARFSNNRTGYRVAVGAGGSITGEGGDFIVVDDPHKAEDADSKAALERIARWWDGTMSTRGNDPKTVRRVIVMQRLHQRDLTGHILEKMQQGGESYVHLCLPAEYEPRVWVYNGPLDWRDPRREEGELLWPQRFGPKEIASLKVTLGERGTAGQLQQRPAPGGGAIYRKKWWAEGRNRFDITDTARANRAVARFLSIDAAMKPGEENDYTAFGAYELSPDYRLYKVWGMRAKLTLPQLVREIEAQARRYNRDNKLSAILIEDAAGGTGAIQTLREAGPDWLAPLLVAWPAKGSKVVRARQASIWCERDMVLLPNPDSKAPWLYDFEAELFDHPNATHDDQADEFAQIILYLEHFLREGFHM